VLTSVAVAIAPRLAGAAWQGRARYFTTRNVAGELRHAIIPAQPGLKTPTFTVQFPSVRLVLTVQRHVNVLILFVANVVVHDFWAALMPRGL
jgi:hypothetical protein